MVRPYHGRDRYFPSRDAGITGFSHIGLRTSDPGRDEAFWAAHFNIRASDWLGDCGLLTFDEVHHRFALFPSDRPGVQHINHQVEILRACKKDNPRICFVPTATGDYEGFSLCFYRRFAPTNCRATDLQLFKRQVADLEDFASFGLPPIDVVI